MPTNWSMNSRPEFAVRDGADLHQRQPKFLRVAESIVQFGEVRGIVPRRLEEEDNAHEVS